MIPSKGLVLGSLLILATSLTASCSEPQAPSSPQQISGKPTGHCTPQTYNQMQAIASKANGLTLGATEKGAQDLLGEPAFRFPMKNKQGTRLDGWMWYYTTSCPPPNSFPNRSFISLIFRLDSGLVAIDQEGFAVVKHRSKFQAQ